MFWPYLRRMEGKWHRLGMEENGTMFNQWQYMWHGIRRYAMPHVCTYIHTLRLYMQPLLNVQCKVGPCTNSEVKIKFTLHTEYAG